MGLYMMSNNIHFFRVGLYIDGFRGVLFTGKLVKTIIIRVLPELGGFFQPSRSGYPKLIHVSPLYTRVGGRIRCVYSSIDCRGDTARCGGRPSQVVLNGDYWFYIGFSEKLLSHEKFLEAVMGLDDCFVFMDQRVCAVLSELEYINMREAILDTARRVLGSGKLKIVFSSPTMLRDPFKRTKHKSLIPTVFNIFSTPLYLMLHNTGSYSLRKYRRQLLILHKIFNEPYTTLKTVKLKWIVYKHRPEPTITGYMNLFINQDYLQYYGRYIDMEKYLGEILTYMAALGVGVGRATGFGHVTVEPGQKKENAAEGK